MSDEQIREVPENHTTTDGTTQGTKLSKSARKRHKQREAARTNDTTSDTVANSIGNSTNAHDAASAEDDETKDGADPEGGGISINDLRVAMEAFSLQRPAKTAEEALGKSYEFWNTQPVPKMDEKITVNEPIEPDKPMAAIRAECYTLPDGFQWDTLTLDDPLVLKELYTLLNENYVEDDDCMFRFDYQPEFLKWALQPPGWRKDWHCGVRVVKSNRLVGFISAIPATINIYSKTQRMVEINFLCVHKKLRSKRVAPVLIREITRRVHMTGCFQAVYTAGIVLPKPVGFCSYWHRSLNPKKLIEVKFSPLSRNMTMQRTLKLYKLADSPKTAGYRQMKPADVPQAHKLLENYLKRFDLAPHFSEAEFAHWFLPRPNIVDSFVVESQQQQTRAAPSVTENGDGGAATAATVGEITDFVSYYTLPSTVMHHATHKTLKAAYSFYNVAGKTPCIDLMNDALISAKQLGFDVFNALDLMDNRTFLEPLKFRIGDGNLQYYLYNWRCPSMQPPRIGLVLQ